MILSDKDILKEIEAGKLEITNFNKEHLNPASYDMTLAPSCKVYLPDGIGINDPTLALKAFEDLGFDKMSDEELSGWHLDCRNKNQKAFEFEITEEGFVLIPGHLYLYSCNESLKLDPTIAGTVMGKSSLGRLGLDIHICAGFGDPGFEGSLVLEMRTIYPLKIYPNMKICQIRFDYLSSVPNEHYGQKSGSKYQGQVGVQESKMHENFKS